MLTDCLDSFTVGLSSACPGGAIGSVAVRHAWLRTTVTDKSGVRPSVMQWILAVRDTVVIRPSRLYISWHKASPVPSPFPSLSLIHTSVSWVGSAAGKWASGVYYENTEVTASTIHTHHQASLNTGTWMGHMLPRISKKEQKKDSAVNLPRDPCYISNYTCNVYWWYNGWVAQTSLGMYSCERRALWAFSMIQKPTYANV